MKHVGKKEYAIIDIQRQVLQVKKELKKLLLEVPHFFQVRLVELIRAIQKLMRSSFAAEAM